MIAQGRPSRSEYDGDCLYRGPDGSKCAAGVLIPDELYNPRFEGTAADQKDVGSILSRLGHDLSLVRDLQVVHDEAGSNHFIRDFRDAAAVTAQCYGLDASVLNDGETSP
jgi:hypothetical protein